MQSACGAGHDASVVNEPEVLADRVHKYAPPPWRMYDALVDEVEDWLTLRPGEVRPKVVGASRPDRVVWSSLWPVSPGDTIEFTIEPDSEGQGSEVRFVWRSPSPPDDRGVGLVRHRLNQALGEHLRMFVDTGSV